LRKSTRYETRSYYRHKDPPQQPLPGQPARYRAGTVQFEEFQQQRVDVTGRRLGFDPTAATADAEWVKHRLARVQASLPNGYCGRPPQQHCPHPNACLSCPDFQTTPQFLPIHRRHRDDTLELIAVAERDGRTRQADNHRQVRDNLEQIIGALEAIKEDKDDRGGQG
jgi:hypothetical protein